jgi:hypothetical protein
MNILFISNKNEISDLVENEMYDSFQVQNLSFKCDPESITEFKNYDLCIIEADLKSNLSGGSFSISGYFSSNKKEIIESSTVFIFISNDNSILEPFFHRSFKNILTFKYAKTKQHNLSKLERFIKTDLCEINSVKKHIKRVKLCLFVHGFSGDQKTWSKLEDLIKNDSDIKHFKVEYFNYDSFEFNVKNIKEKFKIRKYTNIRGLANSLKTIISNHEYDDLIIVGHSLGCLIIKKFLLLNHKYKWSLHPENVILFAPPNKGSRLANPLLLYSLTNPHVIYLSSFSYKRRLDNLKWWLNKIETKTNIKVVIGENDKTVRVNSATYGFKQETLIHFHDTNHIDIKEPGSSNSQIYKTFKKIISN